VEKKATRASAARRGRGMGRVIGWENENENENEND
jgi:hypothetical protein